MNPFDAVILSFTQTLVRQSSTFDTLVQVWASNNLLKSGVIVPLTWWAWFAAGEDRRRVR